MYVKKLIFKVRERVHYDNFGTFSALTLILMDNELSGSYSWKEKFNEIVIFLSEKIKIKNWGTNTVLLLVAFAVLLTDNKYIKLFCFWEK